MSIALVWVAHVTVCGAELLRTAGEWRLQAELSDARGRGEYQGVAQLGDALGAVWTPAAAVGLDPATRAAHRHLARVGVTGRRCRWGRTWAGRYSGLRVSTW